jgi:hypothetical protein
MLGAFSWVHKRAARAGYITARLVRQAMVNACFGDQRMEITVKIAHGRLRPACWRW